MDTIISAVISAAATIIVAVIAYQVKLAKMADNAKQSNQKCDNILISQKDLSGEHTKLSGEHTQLIGISNDIKKTVFDIDKTVSEEKVKQDFRYNNLTEKQKDIIEITNSVKAMQSELLRLQAENTQLRGQLLEVIHDKQQPMPSRDNETLSEKVARATKQSAEQNPNRSRGRDDLDEPEL